MRRRNALRNISFVAGGSLVIPATLFSSCQSDSYQPLFFTKKDIQLINEIGETILPETADSPGAKALKVANFIDVYVADCYTLENQQILKSGLIEFEKMCQEKWGNSFRSLSGTDKHNCLVNLDKIAKESNTPHYFSLLKSLVLFGYFTSKEGAEKALRYVPIPGKFQGDIPYEKGDKAWALA